MTWADPSVLQSEQQLHETMAWCGARANPAAARSCLRSLELMPWQFAGGPQQLVNDLIRRRSTELARPPRALAIEPSRGRLMVYFPSLQLCDGAAELESQGFFDVDNTPPWDSWVAFETESSGRGDNRSEFLVAWVPAALVPLATAGIQVNPEECILWLEDCRHLGRPRLAQWLARAESLPR